jgi:crotonobetainyl-CoA:carnitine CoA-transferase CaiB-like acyl-CoA transferase
MNMFKDLFVLELASVLAGPQVGQFFAELGARVIKVENRRTGGDVTRGWKGAGENPTATTSAYFHATNYGKESYLLDLRDATDKARVETWLSEADILISNFRPAAAEQLGMSWTQLRDRYPGLIYAELGGFGPGEARPAFDIVLQAETGWLSMTGTTAGEPARLPVALIDILAAHQLKEAILVALLQRERTGRGSRVYTDLYAASLSALANQATNYLIGGSIPGRRGTEHPNIAPYGDIFHTVDQREVVPAIGTEAHFRSLCELLGLPALAADKRFCDNARRVRHRSALNALLAPAIARWRSDALLAEAHAQSIPLGLVRHLGEVLEDDRARALRLSRTDDTGQEINSIRTVVWSLSPGY